MLDDLRTYLQLASGVTEATTSKARDAVSALLAQGLSLSARAMPAPEMMGQVQELADDLVTTSRNNREMLVGVISAEVDRAVGRMGFVREDELAALRRHVQRLEKQIADLDLAAHAPSADDLDVAAATDAAATDAAATDAAPTDTAPTDTARAQAPTTQEPAPAPAAKKKRVIVPEPGTES